MEEIKPPKHIGKIRWARVLEAYSYGGYVTCNEADAYMPCKDGSHDAACDDGRLPFVDEPYGDKGKTRRKIHTSHSEQLFGTRTSKRTAVIDEGDESCMHFSRLCIL